MAENDFTPAPINDDALSVGSGGSTTSKTNEKMECPHCNKEMQTRVLFKHIRKCHPEEFLENMVDCTPKHFEALVKGCEPVNFTWEITNDFDEKESMNIYGCLACNTAFTSKSRGVCHCKKNKCISEHVNQLRKLRTDALQAEKERKKKMTRPPDYYKDLATDVWLENFRLKASYDKLYSIYEEFMTKGIEHSIVNQYEPLPPPPQDRPNTKAKNLRDECLKYLRANTMYRETRIQLLKDLLWENYRQVEVKFHDVPINELPDAWR
jgi:hypothetical protein